MAEESRPSESLPPAWLYWLVLLLVFILPGQYSHAVTRKHGPFIAYADVLAVLAIGVWALWVLRTRRWRRLSWAPLPVWALLLVAVLSGLGAGSLKLAAFDTIQLVLYYVAGFMLFADVLRSESRQRAAVLALMTATTLVVLYGLFQYATVTHPMALKATFESRNTYSAYLVLSFPLFFGFLLWSDRVWERVWAGLLLVAGAVTIMSPPLLWVLLLVLAITALWRGTAKAFGILALVAVVFCVLTIHFLPLNRQVAQELIDPYEQGPIYKVMEMPGESPAQAHPKLVKKRWLEWMPALNMVAQNFILGVGTGNYQLNIGRPDFYGFLPNVRKTEPDTNNLYLVLGSSMGFAGLVCLLAFLFYFMRRAVLLSRYAASPTGRALAAGLYGMTIAILLTNLFTSLFVRGLALVWALGYALIAARTDAAATHTSAAGEELNVAPGQHTAGELPAG